MRKQGESMDERRFTTEELAARWGKSKTMLAHWRIEGRGPKYLKLGEGIRAPIVYRISDVLEFEKKSAITPKKK